MRKYGCLLFVVYWATLGSFLATPLSAGAVETAGKGMLPPGVVNSVTVSNQSGIALSSYPLQFGRPFLDGAIANAPQVLINGVAVATQADVKKRYTDGSVAYAVIAVSVPAIPATGSLTLTFQNQTAANNTPLTQAQMLAAAFNFDAVLSLTGTATGAKAQIVSARTMLTNGDYKLWTSGPIAQTIELADDTPKRKYDIGFGDGHHPLRPRFYATFWPATHQVWVRVVAENGLTSEVEDVAYKLSISAGQTHPSLVYSADLSGTQAKYPKQHWALTAWTQHFWLGGTPSAQVNIDNNLAYLAATRFLPNYDTSIKPTPTNINNMYGYWVGKTHDIYDGEWDNGSLWQSGMGVAGARGEIAPYPVWTMLWLYTGDWRLRTMALGMADLAASFPGNLREDVAGKRLSRADPPGASTGLGHTVSLTDRRSLLSQYLTYSYTIPADRVNVVGPVDKYSPWSFDGAHQPSPFYPQYLVTGDPWYLNEMYLWAGFTAATYNGAATTGCSCGRGPTGAEGGIDDQLRGAAWVGRNRAETAFIAPDSDPEKVYFTYLMNDALAKWEGGLGITGTVFDGTAEKNWSAKYGNYYSAAPGGVAANGTVSPLGGWEAGGSPPNGTDPSIANNVVSGIYPPAPVSVTFTGSVSGSTLTVTSVAQGSLRYLMLLSDASGALAPFSYLNQDVTGVGVGSYAIAPEPQNVRSETMHGQYGSSAVGLFDAIWCEWYLTYALDRIEELGFAAEALRSHLLKFPIGMINNSGLPLLISMYEMPMASPTAWFTNWAGVIGGLTKAFVTGVGWNPSLGADLSQYFADNLADDGRPIWLMAGLAGAAYRGDPGAITAWNWFLTNVYHAIPAGDFQADPKWTIVPRTDSNTLPVQPTGAPSSANVS